jgi:hypothetical protein
MRTSVRDFQGSIYGQFTRALKRGNLLQALALARELPQVSLEDALRLCVLLAEKEPDRFERAAVRWLGQLALERKGLTLAEAHLALVAFRALPSAAAEKALAELASRSSAETA